MANTKRSAGTFTPINYVMDDLDRAILRVLPDEGSTIGKYLPRGVIVPELNKLVDPEISPYVYVSRLKVMMGHGYTVAKKGSSTGGRKVWQRTKKGRLAAGVNLPGEEAASG